MLEQTVAHLLQIIFFKKKYILSILRLKAHFQEIGCKITTIMVQCMSTSNKS
jgi:hypothetical protein